MNINEILESQEWVHANATMFLVGTFLWFVVKWAMGRGKWKSKGGFWFDQKDEIIVTLCIGFALIVYDTQLIHVYDMFLEYVMGIEKESPTTMKPHYWFVVGFMIDKGYRLLKKNKNEEAIQKD